MKTLNEGYFKRGGTKDSKINKACSKKYKVDVLALGEVYKRHNYKNGRKYVRIGIKAKIILVMPKLMFMFIQ